MEMSPWLVAVIVCAIVVVGPVFLLRPLVVAIANRISGKRSDSDEVKALRAQVATLNQQVAALQSRMLAAEEQHEFTRKLLEDSKISRKNG
jgi:hypothetical protein